VQVFHEFTRIFYKFVQIRVIRGKESLLCLIGSNLDILSNQ
jgi:hypothetical protein